MSAATDAKPRPIRRSPRQQALLREPLWLDRHLEARLAGVFSSGPRGQAACPEARERAAERLEVLLRLWQWRMLGKSALHAVEGSRHYKNLLDNHRLEALFSEAAKSAGLDRAAGAANGKTGKHGPGMPEPECLAKALRHALSGLPFTLPESLTAAPESFLAVSHDAVSGVISLPTSGTTGAGKRIFSSREDMEQTSAFFRHGMRYMVRPGRGHSVALLMSGERPGSVGDLLVTGMRSLGVPCSVPGFVPASAQGEDAMMERLASLAPTCLVGVPGQVLALARHREAATLARSLRSVLLSGDSVTPAMRAAIAEGFGCEVFVHYGLTETGLGGAVECRLHSGCHMREADLIHEIVDERGAPLPPGAWGEIVITTLTRDAMPLLRYRTGDEGRVLPGRCACGSVLARLDVRGRMAERIGLPGGGFLHTTDLDSRLYALADVQKYRAVLHGAAGGACLALYLRFDRDLSGAAVTNALAQAKAALGSLPGVRPALTPAGQCEAGALPVFLLEDKEERSPENGRDLLRRGQAKQSVFRTGEPFIWPR